MEKPKAHNDYFVVQLNLHEQRQDDQLPLVALYQLDGHGRAVEKIAVADDNVLHLPFDLAERTELIALGPDVDALAQLDNETLIHYRSAEIAERWQELGQIDLPRLRWHPWWKHFVCVSGKVKKCWFKPFRNLSGATLLERSDLLPQLIDPPRLLTPFLKCAPLCNGVVEIHERICCCYWWDIIPRIPELIPELIPIPFPDPDPGPLRNFEKQIKRYQASVEPSKRVPLDTRVVTDLNVLVNMRDQQQIYDYVVARPYLLPVFCKCKSKKVGKTQLNVDGSFNFCYARGLFIYHCSVTYFYKVKQFIGSTWVTVYDGEAAKAYFTAGEMANLTTFSAQAQTCTPPQEPPIDDHGRPFVMLQEIGTTRTHKLHSPAQSSLTGVTGADNSGLLDQSYSTDCPLGRVLKFLLWIDPQMKAVGARYYRFSRARTDVAGEIIASSLQVMSDSVSWDRWANGVWPPEPENVALGPVNPATVGNQIGLIRIPYFDGQHRWLGNQYHYTLDTRGMDNGRYMLILELFDAAGNRLRPVGAAGAGINANFHYVHWGVPTATTVVNYAQLLHVLHINNTHCFADIVDLRKDGVSDNAECQFKSGSAGSQFSVGFRAYHLDDFMLDYNLTYQRGLNGTGTNGSGSLANGTNNQPATKGSGSEATSPSQTFGYLLGNGEHQKCTFSLELRARARHTDGDDRLSGYDAEDDASFALEIA